MYYSTIKELLELAEREKVSIAEIVIITEVEDSDKNRDYIEGLMYNNLEVMRHAVKEGKKGIIKSRSGMVGGDAKKLSEWQSPFNSGIYREVLINALAVGEVNAGMGKIVAGPTAGSSGIVPAVLLALGEELKLDDRDLLRGLFTASGLGQVVAKKATLAGAAGGCQAECGVASGMAAGMAVELINGTAEMVTNAFALALKNLLGLVCDPVAGLVEVPCVKRNGFAATHALSAASMALAGIKSVIPPDEVIAAMADIGNMMHVSLKETALGGLAVTPTGLKIKEKLSAKPDKS
jgi:L-serine dehydratase